MRCVSFDDTLLMGQLCPVFQNSPSLLPQTHSWEGVEPSWTHPQLDSWDSGKVSASWLALSCPHPLLLWGKISRLREGQEGMGEREIPARNESPPRAMPAKSNCSHPAAVLGQKGSLIPLGSL